jgi:hypothetical protein
LLLIELGEGALKYSIHEPLKIVLNILHEPMLRAMIPSAVSAEYGIVRTCWAVHVANPIEQLNGIFVLEPLYASTGKDMLPDRELCGFPRWVFSDRRRIHVHHWNKSAEVQRWLVTRTCSRSFDSAMPPEREGSCPLLDVSYPRSAPKSRLTANGQLWRNR